MKLTHEQKNARNYGTILNYNNDGLLLVFYGNKYFMFSETTVVHVLPQTTPNNHGFMSYDSVESGVKSQWEGFIANQTR